MGRYYKCAIHHREGMCPQPLGTSELLAWRIQRSVMHPLHEVQIGRNRSPQPCVKYSIIGQSVTANKHARQGMRCGVDIRCGVKARIDHWIRGGIFESIEKQFLRFFLQPYNWFRRLRRQLGFLRDELPESETIK